MPEMAAPDDDDIEANGVKGKKDKKAKRRRRTRRSARRGRLQERAKMKTMMCSVLGAGSLAKKRRRTKS